MYHAYYIPSQRVVMSPDQKVLFTITVESINEMLQLQPGPNLTTLSIGDLLDQYSKLSPFRRAQLLQDFIIEEQHIPKVPSPPCFCHVLWKEQKNHYLDIMYSRLHQWWIYWWAYLGLHVHLHPKKASCYYVWLCLVHSWKNEWIVHQNTQWESI